MHHVAATRLGMAPPEALLGGPLGTPEVRPRLRGPMHRQALARAVPQGTSPCLSRRKRGSSNGRSCFSAHSCSAHSSSAHCFPAHRNASFQLLAPSEPASARRLLHCSFGARTQPADVARPGCTGGRAGGWRGVGQGGVHLCRAHHGHHAEGGGVGAGGGAEEALSVLTSLYPLYVALGGALGVWQPGVYQWFLAGAPGSLSLALGVIMGVMGLTLRVDELLEVLLARPQAVAFGCFCQYFLMPLSGLLVVRLFSLPTDLAAGLLLLSCCPGGTASNVVTFIARGDVPLSVIMTLVSTLLAAVATPLLTQLLIGAMVPVDLLGLARSTLQVVLLPVLLGAGLNTVFPAAAKTVAPLCPLVAVLVSSLLASSVFSSTLSTFLSARAAQSALASSAAAASAAPGAPTSLLTVAAAVVTVHFIGFLLGYWVSKVAGYTEEQRRAISIEVGMQNSSLGVVLALQHLPSPNSSMPAALSAIIMNVMGSSLGAAWRIFGSHQKALEETR